MTEAELDQILHLWKQTSPGEWKAAKHGSRPDWFTEGPDISVPYMPQGDAEFIVAAHRVIPTMVREMKSLTALAVHNRPGVNQDVYFKVLKKLTEAENEIERLKMYETVLQLRLGHIVELLRVAALWREDRYAQQEIDQLTAVIDLALAVENKRAG